jgi:hypothetical protein
MTKKTEPWANDTDFTFTREQAITELTREIDGHSFLLPKYALAICAAFGVRPVFVEKQRANDGEFKGLTTPDGVPKYLHGVSAWNLAEHIADELKLSYPGMNGRGSRYRVAVDAIVTKEKAA